MKVQHWLGSGNSLPRSTAGEPLQLQALHDHRALLCWINFMEMFSIGLVEHHSVCKSSLQIFVA
ncbi:MAG: hypothetical protein LBR80_10470 [Deltaproteobacteria bacterium]|nr:hypothetical protein [Deltaproteobacteria bacterium]